MIKKLFRTVVLKFFEKQFKILQNFVLGTILQHFRFSGMNCSFQTFFIMYFLTVILGRKRIIY